MQHAPAAVAPHGEHRLHVDERRGAGDARQAARLLPDFGPVRPLAPARAPSHGRSARPAGLRSSPSKPFITEMIVISAATPRHTPSIDTQLMNDTKNCRGGYGRIAARERWVTVEHRRLVKGSARLPRWIVATSQAPTRVNWHKKAEVARCRSYDFGGRFRLKARLRRSASWPDSNSDHAQNLEYLPAASVQPVPGPAWRRSRTALASPPTVWRRRRSADFALGVSAVRGVLRERPGAPQRTREEPVRTGYRCGPRARGPCFASPRRVRRNGEFCLHDARCSIRM